MNALIEPCIELPDAPSFVTASLVAGALEPSQRLIPIRYGGLATRWRPGRWLAAFEVDVNTFWRAYAGFEASDVGIDRVGEFASVEQYADVPGLTRQALCARAYLPAEDAWRA